MAMHSRQLMVALIPESVCNFLVDMPNMKKIQFTRKLHFALAESFAVLMQRRERLIREAERPTKNTPIVRSALAEARAVKRLDSQRHLSVAEMRTLEQLQRAGGCPVSDLPVQQGLLGARRGAWLRSQLVLILSQMIPCAPAEGASTAELLELFETQTGETYHTAVGGAVMNRLSTLGRVVSGLVGKHALNPPLRVVQSGKKKTWSRRPPHPVEGQAWFDRQQAQEDPDGVGRAKAVRRGEPQRQAQTGMARWIKHHKHLKPVGMREGEPAVALMLL